LNCTKHRVWHRPDRRSWTSISRGCSVEASGRMGEHGIDLARLRHEIGAREHLSAIFARDFLEQPLEVSNVAIDGALEVAFAAIALADLLERLLALHGVELAREHVALAALVAIPQLRRSLVVDHAGNLDREGVERLDARALGAGGLAWSAPKRRCRR